MKIAVILGSQRRNGTCSLIEKRIAQINKSHECDFIRMSELKVEACIACFECSYTGKCSLLPSDNDKFEDILYRLKIADVILVITPIYSPYPSRLTALFERLLSVSYFSHEIGSLERPLKNKMTGIICYGSSKIEDETQLKLLFQKFLMDDYSFTEVNYNYINKHENVNHLYRNVVEYVEHVFNML